MAGSVLLDTNVVIALFAGESSVRERFDRRREIFLPITALGELYYGAHKSSHAQANLARIDEFAATIAVLPCDTATARYYGQTKSS